MNNIAINSDSDHNLLFLNFNQDVTSLAVGSKSCYRLFSFNSTEKLDVVYQNDTPDTCIVERLFSSSLVATVSLQAPRKLRVWHFKKSAEITSCNYFNTILSVKLNRLRLVVCLEESIYIHNIKDMVVLHTIKDIPSNPLGLCALSTSNENCFLAYPSSNQSGQVQIFDADKQRDVVNILAHDNPLAAIAFDPKATMIATASEKGTVIRVFSIPEGQKLYEFRRGMKRSAVIHSLSFSQDSTFLCCSSNTETIHIFKLQPPEQKSQPERDNVEEGDGGWMGYFSGALKLTASYLPSQVSEMLNQGRDFAIARLSHSGLKNACAISYIQKTPFVLVACQDGYLYIYGLNADGGDCPLIKQHKIDSFSENRQLDVFQSPSPARSLSKVSLEEAHDVLKNKNVNPEASKHSDENEFPPVLHKN